MSTVLKPLKFVSGQPLVIRIHKDHGFWQIEPSAADKPEMNRRGRGTTRDASDSDMPGLDQEYAGRRAAKAPPLPHFKMHSGHTPIVIREGEFVKFVCDPPSAFCVWAERERTTTPILDAPGNPFGWKLPQIAPPNSDINTQVLKKVGNFGPREQRFYKFSAWIVDVDTGQTVTVDPDAYCDR